MSRLVEIQLDQPILAPLAVRAGDVLMFQATGARVHEGGSAVEMWGPFRTAVVGADGSILAPEGPPNAVLVRVRQPGSATLDVFSGDPFHGPRTSRVQVVVES